MLITAALIAPGRTEVNRPVQQSTGEQKESIETMKAVYFYTDDWFSSKDIRAMSATQERGFFRLLLSQSVETNGKLVCNDVEIGRLTLMGTRDGARSRTDLHIY